MKLAMRVTRMVEARGEASSLDLAPDLPKYRADQVRKALVNAKYRGRLQRVGMERVPGTVRTAVGRYGQLSGFAAVDRPVSSVWDYAEALA